MSERRQQQTPSPFHRLSTSDAEETSQLTAKVLFRETRPDEAPFLKKSVPRTGTIDNSRSWRNVEIDEETIEEHKVDLHIYGDNKQTELVFKVRARSWKLSLLDWVAKFQEQCCGQWETGDGDTPMLQLNDVAFFNRDCVPAHLSVPVQSISFGNMINAATYLSHFNRNIAQGQEAERSCKLLGALRGNQWIKHAMFVDMEHDRSVLTVRFALLDGGYKMSTNGQCAQSKDAVHIPASAVAVRMRYTSVRRIIFDTQVERNGNQVTRVYFQLNYPVEIRRYRRRPTAGRLDSIIRGDGDRQCYFPENDNDPQNNNPQNKDNFTMAINDSPFMYIEFDSSLEKDKLYEIMCRLYARIGLPMEFITIECIAAPVSRYVDPPVRVIGHDYRRERDLSSLSEAEINDQKQRLMTPIEPKVDKKWVDELKRRKCFGLEYFIAALISRGAVVKDQILRSEERKDGFMRKILKNFDHDREVTLETLERLLNAIDERRETPSLLATFDSIKENLQSHPDDLTKIYEKEKQGDYRRVRKVVLTPTRMLLVVPELLMGNRVLRKFDGTGDKALRIQFRDDNGEALKLNQVGQTIINVTVHNTMRRGIYISDRHFIYLASSNSQMRDSGCYFFDEGEDGKQVEEIRNQLGIFNKSNIPKLMARIGQCFTQAKESKVELRHKHYNQTFDIIGGRDTSGEPYTFSDGCGRISVKYAEDIASDLDLGNCVPSCFQIRFRGIKGVVSVDPWLSDRTEWSEKHSVPDNREKYKRKNKLRIHFRPSQIYDRAYGDIYGFCDPHLHDNTRASVAVDLIIALHKNKFHGSVEMYIEIVKYSSPTGVCLNRPFIAILDQVSAMQGYKLHCRMTDRICELLDRQLMELAEALMLENSCRESLIELPRRINIEELSLAGGFALTQEPFFRSLLRASVAYTIKKQLSKAQIKIPPNLGRTMFGVIDETGILQYGQVFVQYSKAISNKKPARNAAKKILKGRILMTKNPQIVAGDARVFEAIDVPELRHLVNVVVFPQYGPRPHPDEMAGSDLDGDEYCVIWDERLLLENNEEPIDFTKTVRMPDNVDDSEVVPKMIEFFVNYIKQDSIGTIANAFMVNADLYGITSQVCMNIARKQSQSVDFPKTGQPPAPLVKQWTQQEDGTFLPPEKAERWPDFMTKSHKPCYVSPRLLGYLFRRIRLVEDVLAIASVSEQREALELDQDLLYEGREEYSGIARERYNAYCADVGALLDNYGIPDEGQLFSGCVSVIRNRISDRDMDDMSFYNTLHMIEQKMSEVFLRYRIDFYKEFGGYVENTEAELSYGGSDTSEANERRICKNPSEDMQKKASAYYEICYGEASKNVTGRRILSFPWVVWDVLKSLKRTSETISIDPLNEYLCRAINTYCVDNESAMQRFMTHITKQSSSVHAIKRYCRRFEGLDRLMFIVCEWAKSERLLEDCLKMEHLCILLIQFGLGYLTDQDASSPNVFLEKTDTLLNVDEQSDEDGGRSSADECVNLNDRLGGLGKCFMDFVQVLSSRRFETMKLINFMHPNLGFHSILMRGQWRHLHKAALKTLYYIVLTGRFSLLNHRIVETQNYSRSEETAVDEIYLSELEPFVIELPDDVSNEEEEELIEKMRLHSGVKYLRLRRLTKPRDHVVVSAVGTMESLHRLRALVAVKPSLNSFNNTKKRSEMVSRLVYERISALV